MCGKWNVRQAMSQQVFTASVQSDHLLRGYLLPVFFDNEQSHHTPCSTEIQPMSQQAAATTHLYHGLVLDIDTCALPVVFPRHR